MVNLVTCFILLCLNSYMICQFYQITTFFLRTIRIKSVGRVKFFVWLIILLITIELTKDFIFDNIRESLNVFQNRSEDQEIALFESFYPYARVLDFVKQPLPFIIAVYIVNIFKYFGQD